MELQCPRTMLIVFVVTITAVLTEFNNTTDITLTVRRPKHVFKSKSEWKTKTTRTMNAGNVNTMQKPNSAEGVEWKFPSTPGVIKTTIFQKHLEKEKISTTDISIKDTKNEQENISYSAVTLMHSAYSTNSNLATNNSTAFSHHRDNSEHIGTIVGLTVVVVVTVVGSVFLCYYKRLLCFKRNEKYYLDKSSLPMLRENTR